MNENNVKVNLDEAEKFLKLLYHGDSAEYASRAMQAEEYGLPIPEREEQPSMFTTYSKPKPELGFQTHKGTLTEVASELQARTKAGCGIHVCINDTGGAPIEGKYVKRIQAVFADDDKQRDDGPRTDFPVEPSIIVESSPGRYHYYWLVTSITVETYRHTQQAIAERFECDAGTKAPARTMRLPGSIHEKGKPFRVRIVSAGGRVFDAIEIQTAFPPLTMKRTHKRVSTRGSEQISLAQVRSALKHVDNDVYADWIMVGMALCNTGEDDAFTVWDEWSEDGCHGKYDGTEANARRWAGFDIEVENPVTVASIFKQAKENGWSGKMSKEDMTALYDELHVAAGSFKEETPTVEIDSLLTQARTLEKIYQERLIQLVKKGTGIPVTALRDQLKLEEKQKMSCLHPIVADGAIERIGHDNIIYAQKAFYLWDDPLTGIWNLFDDEKLQKKVYQLYRTEVDDDFRSSDIESITKLIKLGVGGDDVVMNSSSDKIINVTNGQLVYDAGKWRLEEHDRSRYATQRLPVKYNPDAVAPRFEKFMQEIFEFDDDGEKKALLLLEMIGYAMYSACSFEKFFVLVGGKGANGKSTLFRVLRRLIGEENITTIAMHELNNDYKKASLSGKLANIVPEATIGKSVDEGVLKALTSGDMQQGRHPYGRPFEFIPTALNIFGLNELPHIADHTPAFYRRAIVIRFNRTFEEKEQDRELADKLIEELPGIMRLALHALAGVFERGYFTECESVEQEVDGWRKGNDQVAEFLQEACSTGHEYGRVKLDAIYNHYKVWANNSGIRNTVNAVTFGKRLVLHGFPVKHTEGRAFREGIQLEPIDFGVKDPDQSEKTIEETNKAVEGLSVVKK